jgi:SAM-dependent methyltransferase
MPSSQWDSRFSAEHYIYGREPNAHLVAEAGRLSSGARVLVPGDGEGRNGVWLAHQGMEVLSVDGSAVGLGKARALAQANGVSITTEHADLLTWVWPKARFDAVVSIFLHFPPAERRQVHADMAAALRPGGVLILEAFRPEQLNFCSGGPKDPTMLYRAEDLRSDFAALEIEMIEDAEVSLDEGTLHRGRGAVVRMVACTP